MSDPHLTALQSQVDGMSDRMIDPREFGRLEEEVKQLSKQMEAMQATLLAINSTLNEAKGGWRALMLLGGAGAAVGSLATWALQHVRLLP
jgi:hypothetical protein